MRLGWDRLTLKFIARESTDPHDETKALSATRARQLMGMPTGDTVLDCRDRAILKFFLYSGARLSTACRLKVSDFHQDGNEATLRIRSLIEQLSLVKYIRRISSCHNAAMPHYLTKLSVSY